MIFIGSQLCLFLTKVVYLKLSPDVWRLEHSEGQRLRISGLEKFYGNRDVVCRVDKYEWSVWGGPGLIRPKVTLREVALLEPGAELTGDGTDFLEADSSEAGDEVEQRTTMYLDSGELLGMQVSFFGVPDDPLDSSPHGPLAVLLHGMASGGLLIFAVIWTIMARKNWRREHVSHDDSRPPEKP
jgi:hypothetical protein